LEIRRTSQAHKLITDQFVRLAQKLNLNVGSLSDSSKPNSSALDTNIQKYLEAIAIEGESAGATWKVYDESTILLLGVLLCKGTNKEKAEALFKMFD
jgi:hypothetical protein